MEHQTIFEWHLEETVLSISHYSKFPKTSDKAIHSGLRIYDSELAIKKRRKKCDVVTEQQSPQREGVGWVNKTTREIAFYFLFPADSQVGFF